ncbi:dihydroxy-acid dehydratase [Methylocaldum marinum]|uniref:Dihydroxy-acid dehydratase n=1 Tax=Methylocaldum marinum TaxID=1432792 RepID=A0A250KRQ8_9GAMM|nr:dihydroxy-acid dehydratase [Methylocaldum marinum]
MREMLSPTSAVMDKRWANDVTLITDGRFCGGTHGFVVGHITRGPHVGGPLAIVRDGDTISIEPSAVKSACISEKTRLPRGSHSSNSPSHPIRRGARRVC